LGRDIETADALSLRGVNALYGDSHVLHNVSFSVKQGRVLALLGRNGAGKTTCMNTIIGFLRPRDGDIRLPAEALLWLVTAASLRPKHSTANLRNARHSGQSDPDALVQGPVLGREARFADGSGDILHRHGTAVNLEDCLDVGLE